MNHNGVCRGGIPGVPLIKARGKDGTVLRECLHRAKALSRDMI